MPTKLILIRHGVTEWNLSKRYCGSMDIGLSMQGRKQAKGLYKKLKGQKIHKVYSSTAKRAIQTAKIVFKGFRIQKAPDLKEIDFGCFEGLTYGQIMERYKKVYKKWLDNPFSTTIPKGEDLRCFRKRVAGALNKIILANPDKTVAVVSHGGAISIFITHILKSAKDFWKKIPDAASISIIEYRNGKPNLKLFNDCQYLGRLL